jgi:Tfp pilus assembly protein PilX
MRETNDTGRRAAAPGYRSERGFVLPYVTLMCVVLMAFSSLMLTSAQDLAHGTRSIEEKNDTFNAAEAGLNAALDSLNTSLLNLGSSTGTLADGDTYTYTIHSNLLAILSQLITDPITGGTVTIPGSSALIVSVGTDPNGGRPTTVEALVAAHSVTVDFQKYAIIAGRNIQGASQSGITDLGQSNSALVHANGSVNASLTGAFQGSASASGDTDTLPPGQTGATLIALPTVGQFDTMVSNFEDEVQLNPGPADLYEADGTSVESNYSCPAPAPKDGCILFYDGSLDLTSTQVTSSGPWTLVVNGDFTQGPNSGVTFVGQPGLVVTNGNASIEGDGLTNTYVEVKGSTLYGGSGSISGALITLGNFTFDSSGSSGDFKFDANVVPPSKIIAGRVKVVTYAEY